MRLALEEDLEVVGEARDAAEAIGIDYAPLPAVTEIADAMRSGAAQVWSEVPGNVAYDAAMGDEAAVAEAAERLEVYLVARPAVPAT